MINIKIDKNNFLDLNVEAYVYFLEHNFDFSVVSDASKKLYPALERTIKQRKFTGAAGSSLLLTGIHEGKGVELILLGLGDLKTSTKNIEFYRRAIGRLVRLAETHKFHTVAINLPDAELLNLSYEKLVQETVTIAYTASYHFDKFITNPERKFTWHFDLYISTAQASELEIQKGVSTGICIGNAINDARYCCDMPPSSFTPEIFANMAVDMAKEYGLKSTVFNEQQIINMGMGGISGVSRGSCQECRLVILEYFSNEPNAPTIAIVGKGITFDSGGLSIKPATAMETMKDDMAGAAVVISTMKVIAQLKPKINVVALAPMSENMPGCAAVKPGDVLTFYNGKTAEVLNTDAEGRLILADALAYAVKNFKLDAMIDVATLTGMTAHFFGPLYAGLFSQDEALSNRIIKSSKASGDKVWPLPMDDDYKVAIKSSVADMSNTGDSRYKSGAITAAFFLQNFVGDVPWAHLDIAGVAFGVPDLSYYRPGATGFGIRLLVDLIMTWENK